MSDQTDLFTETIRDGLFGAKSFNNTWDAPESESGPEETARVKISNLIDAQFAHDVTSAAVLSDKMYTESSDQVLHYLRVMQLWRPDQKVVTLTNKISPLRFFNYVKNTREAVLDMHILNGLSFNETYEGRCIVRMAEDAYYVHLVNDEGYRHTRNVFVGEWDGDRILNFYTEFITRIAKFDAAEAMQTVNDSAMEGIILDSEALNDVCEDVDNFVKAKDIYEKDLRIPWKRGYMFIGPPGCGKCHHADTEILMYDGTIKKAKDVEVGDLLMGDDSTYRLVGSTCTGRENMYRVKPVKGDSYIVNESHILTLKRSGTTSHGKLKPKGEVVDIALKDYLKLSTDARRHLKGFRVGVDFMEQYVPLSPYLLGYWLGDGNSNNAGITTANPEIVTYFEQEIKKYGLEIKPNKADKYVYYITGGPHTKGDEKHKNHIVNMFRKLNILNNKHIPMLYKVNSRKNRLELLAGIIDSDGHLSTVSNSCCYDLVFKSKKLADDVVFLCRSLGFAAYIKECVKSWSSPAMDNKYQGSGTYHRISLSGDGLENIPVKLGYKKAGTRKQKKDALVTGITVEPLGMGDYYGWTLVDCNGRYLLGDFTVTHNTLCIRSLIKKWGFEYRDISKLLRRNGEIDFSEIMQGGGKQYIDQKALPTRAKPSVCVLEDIDKFVVGQSSGNSREGDSGAVPLHSLLKALDGIDGMGGIMLMATTNYPNQMTESLLARPGRFDRIFKIGLPSQANIERFLVSRKFSVQDTPLAHISEALSGFSMAFVEELVKSAKMKYRRTEFTFQETKEIIDRMREHKKVSDDYLGRKASGMGFGGFAE